MKTIILILLLASAVYTQNIHEVVPGSKGNGIILCIVNESKTNSADNITIVVSNNPKGVEFNYSEVKISKLNPGEEREAVFSFDAKRIPETPNDTLKFLITDNYGNSWKKEILISYTLPIEFRLEQNYPNPFNPTTTIEFAIAQKGRYTLSVYNLLGQLVSVLINDEYQPGYYKVNFDASMLASGMFVYKLSGNNINVAKKMVLVK
jgi:hypothetical protein